MTNSRRLSPEDIPYVFLDGFATPAEEALHYRRNLGETGCSRRELAHHAGRSQAHITKRVPNGGYRPPPLPAPTPATNPRRPPPAAVHPHSRSAQRPPGRTRTG